MRELSMRARFGARLLAGASLLASGAAFAQTTDAPAPAIAASEVEDSSTIVVTAQRRSERLQDVPITITNVDAETLRQSGARSLTDISKLVPGLRFDNRAGLVQPTIRGVGTPINLAGAGTNVGIYVDGFYNPAPLATDFQLLNVESIQVLKGPQGTLFGRNTSGGAILVNTSQPSVETRGVIQGSYGSYNAAKLQGYFTTGLSDKVAVDLAALYSRGDGYVTNVAPKDTQFDNKPGPKVGQYENWSVRTAIKLDLTDNLSIIARYVHDDRNDPTPILYQPFLQNGRPLSASSFEVGNPSVLVPTAPLKPYTIAADEQLAIYGTTDQGQLTVNLDLGFGSLTSYTMYRKDKATQYYSLDYGVRKITALIYPDDNKTFTQELILTSKPGGRLQYTVGAFYYDNTETYPGVKVSAGGNPFFQSAASGVNTVSIAGFVDATYEVVDNLFLTGGLRYTHDKQQDAYFVTSAFANPPLQRVDIPTQTSDRVTPRAVIRYAPSTQSSVYASYAQGFKSAIINVGGGTLNNIFIRPEKIDAFEVGYKYAAHGFSFDISGYYYLYKDQQVTANFNVGNPPVPQSIITNAAESKIYGIDTELSYQVSRHFRLNLGASWNHSRFSDFPNAPFFQENTNAQGIPIGSFTVTTVDASGGHMSRAPDFTASAAAVYSLDLAGGLLDLSGNLYYTSRIYFDPVEQFAQKPYATLGLRAEWTNPTERFSVGVAASNITDTAYLIIASANSAGISSAYGPPRTFEGFVRFKF